MYLSTVFTFYRLAAYLYYLMFSGTVGALVNTNIVVCRG